MNDPQRLARRFRRHAAVLADNRRSPLYVRLMEGAADDLEAGGIVAGLFDDVPAPPGSVPQLRLMAALHELVLAGLAPELAAFYPSAGGDPPFGARGRDPAAAWPAARRALRENTEWIAPRLPRTVQTNEPGRSAVLYPVLLWLSECHGRRPIRLLELGASAGLNLLADRYAYVHEDDVLGDAASAVRFVAPWRPGPPGDLVAAAATLRIVHRQGCDPHPLDPSNPDDRRRLLSYIWPDETERLERLRAALEIAAPTPPMVVRSAAGDWLPDALRRRGTDELTVVWHSVVRQYVDPGEWGALEAGFGDAAHAAPERPLVWVGMEPGEDHLSGFEVVVRCGDATAGVCVARCGDHGPPVVWETAQTV